MSTGVPGYQPSLGIHLGTEGAPGRARPPLVFEPPFPLVQRPEAWIATVGDDAWGGATVFMSEDDDDYRHALGQLSPSMTMGTLLDPIAAAPAHHAHRPVTFHVELAGPKELPAVTPAQAIARQSDLYIGTGTAFEIVATTMTKLVGQSATGDHVYACSSALMRGGYGTGRCPDWSLMAHEPGARVLRLDRHVFRVPLEARHVGQRLWFKCCAENEHGDGDAREDPSDVEPVALDVVGRFHQRDPRRWL